MAALHAAPAASPVRTRRADRSVSTGPRNNAPVARRPREASWVAVPAPAACHDVVPEREVSLEEFAAGFAFVDAATGRSVAASAVADLDTVRVVRLRPDAPASARPATAAVAVAVAPVAPSPARVSRAGVASAPRYEWTPRGLAVLLALVALVAGVVATTVVSAFLAISPEPLPAQGPDAVGAQPLSLVAPAR